MVINSKIKAFTIIELMITLAVAAILAALAGPSFVDIIKDNRLTTEINELSSALNLSRSEAIKRGLTVTTCRSSNGSSCTGTWQSGWIVFVDIDDDGTVDGGEDVLRVHGALSSSNTLDFGGAGNIVTHEASGFAIGHAGAFTLCDDRGDANAKGLVVSPTGRVRTADSSDLASC